MAAIQSQENNSVEDVKPSTRFSEASTPNMATSSQIRVPPYTVDNTDYTTPTMRRTKSPFQRKPVNGGIGLNTEREMSTRTTSQQSVPVIEHSRPTISHPHLENSVSPLRQPYSLAEFEPPNMSLAFNASDYDSSITLQPQKECLSAEEEALPEQQPEQQPEQLQYHHLWDDESPLIPSETANDRSNSLHSAPYDQLLNIRNPRSRPASTQSPYERPRSGGRGLTPQGSRSALSASPFGPGRSLSNSPSPDSRSASQSDLLNISYSQQLAQQNRTFDNARLRSAVGTNAALLDNRKTLDMYRANAKKTTDPAISYEFAIFMISAAQELALEDPHEPGLDGLNGPEAQAELIEEARQILQRLADRTYVFAQYYLADGYASGLFSKGKADYEKAFGLFVSAGKHGHAESGYRAALCYEFGWGCHRSYAKAVQFYRQAASKGHPGAAYRLGAACLAGDLGMSGRYREGIKWLKRATEAADVQHNSAPYDLGVMHATGDGEDIFKDEGYAAQLFTKAAELGHPEANLRMGEAYEHGLLTCPRDPALSIHFFTAAAEAGLPKAMMALCAWYLLGAEPILEKDEQEAYAWALKAADTDYSKAEYAVGYFTEMGIGCRRDRLEANVWYVRAADHGEERAKQRLQIMKAAETGDLQSLPTISSSPSPGKKKKHWWNGQGVKEPNS